MALNINFSEDIADRLEALRLTNERLLALAEDLGADSRDIALIRAVILGTLADVAVSFGLHRPDFVAILEGKRFPVVTNYTFGDVGGDDAPKTRT